MSLVCLSAFYVFPTVLPACRSWPCVASVRIGRIRKSLHQSVHFVPSQVKFMKINSASLEMLKLSAANLDFKATAKKVLILILSQSCKMVGVFIRLREAGKLPQSVDSLEPNTDGRRVGKHLAIDISSRCKETIFYNIYSYFNSVLYNANYCKTWLFSY